MATARLCNWKPTDNFWVYAMLLEITLGLDGTENYYADLKSVSRCIKYISSEIELGLRLRLGLDSVMKS